MVAGGIFAFSPLVWRYAVQAEVFSLNNLFVAVLLSLVVNHLLAPKISTVAWFAFWLGLGLTNHHTLVFVGGPFAAWMLYRARASLNVASIARLAACGALGLAPYLYMFVAPADHPTTTWGDTGSPVGFVEHLLRNQYGTFQLGTMDQGGSLGTRLWAYVAQLPGELTWVGAALVPLGLGLLFAKRAGFGSRQRTILSVALAALAFYMIVFGSLSRISLDDPFWYEVHSRFWQQSNLLISVLVGATFGRLAHGAGRVGALLSFPLAVALVVTQLGANYRAQDQSDNRAVSALATAVLVQLPQRSLLVTKGDLYWNTLRYMQVCEGLRPDVRLLDVELLKAPWMTERIERRFDDLALPGSVYRSPSKRVDGSYDLAALFDRVVGRFPVFSNALEHGDSSWRQRYVAWPVGLLERVERAEVRFDVDRWLATTDRWVAEAAVDFPERVPEGSWEEVARAQYRLVESRRGARLLNEAIGGGLSPSQLRRTATILERASTAAARPRPALQLNLGISYYLLRGRQTGAVEKMVEAWKTYLRIAPADDPQRPLVERVLRDPHNADIGLGVR